MAVRGCTKVDGRGEEHHTQGRQYLEASSLGLSQVGHRSEKLERRLDSENGTKAWHLECGLFVYILLIGDVLRYGNTLLNCVEENDSTVHLHM